MADNPEKEIEGAADKAGDLREQLQEVLFVSRDIASEAADLAKSLGMNSIEAASFKKAFKDTASVSQNLVDNAEKLLEGELSLNDIQKDIAKNKQSQIGLDREIEQVLLKAGVAQKDISANLGTSFGLTEMLAEKHEFINSEIADAVKLYEEQITANKENALELDKQETIARKIKDTVGASGKLIEGIGKIPIVGQFIDSKEALKKMNKAAAEGASKMQTMMVGLKSAVQDVIKGALDPLTIAIAALKAGLTFDKQLTNLEKGMALSRGEAMAFRQEMTIAAASSNDLFVNTERIQKGLGILQSQIGFAAGFSSEMSIEAAKMSELFGMSEKAIGGMAQSSLITGKTLEETRKDIGATVEKQKEQTGLSFSHQEILEKVGNTTGQIKAQLGANPEAIAKAVMKAKEFGLELEQVAKAGSALLNFEQSIEAELEAELLTGKQLNLERARALALQGDYAALAEEVASQAGNFTEFSKMNVLQQNALAKSFGMSSDELSEMLMKQEAQGKTVEELRAAGKDELADRLEQRNVQESFNDAVAKMKGIFVDLVGGPLGEFLNILTLALEPINVMMTGLSGILSLFGENRKELTYMESLLGSIAAIFLTIKARAMVIKGITVATNVAKAIGLGFDIASGKASKMAVRGLGSRLGMNVALASAKIFSSLAKIPFGLGIPVAIAAIIGMASLVYGLSKRKAEKGGFIGGKRHSEGGTLIEAEQGEFIMSRKGVQNVGLGNLYSMNKGGGIISGGGRAQEGGEVGSGNQGVTKVVVENKPGVIVASPYGLNDAQYQSRNENFKTRFE